MDTIEQLESLKKLLDSGAINDLEFNQLKNEILGIEKPIPNTTQDVPQKIVKKRIGLGKVGYLVLAAVCICLIYLGANLFIKENISPVDTTKTIIDTFKHYDVSAFKFNESKYKIDTAINDVLVSSKYYSFLALRAQSDSEDIPSDLVIVFIDPKTNKAVFFKGLNIGNTNSEKANIFYNIFKIKSKILSENGDLYISAGVTAGGSGGIQDLYYVNAKNNKIFITSLFDYETGMHSSTEVYLNKNKEEILEIDGISSTVDPAVSFSIQNYVINKYEKLNDKYVKSIVARTKYKYDFDEEDNNKDLLRQMESKEPNTLKSINIKDYKKY